MDGHLAQKEVVNARDLAVHGPPGNNANLVVFGDLQDHVVVEDIERVVHWVNG
jgi:hypothetical protein